MTNFEDEVFFTDEVEKKDINLENFYFHKLKDIEAIEDSKLRIELMKKYMDELKSISSTKEGKIVLSYSDGDSIENISHNLDNFMQENTSEYLSPGSIIIMYNPIVHRTTSKPFTCPVCTSKFIKKTEISIFKPFFWNITKNISYVLDKPAIIDHSCIDFFPTNIAALEALDNRIDSAYENNDDEAYTFSCEYGSFLSKIRRLDRRKRKKNYFR